MKKIALLLAGFATDAGGVAVVGRFLHQIISTSHAYQAHVISLATSMRDPQSVRLLAPRSWGQGIQIISEERHGVTYDHVGACLTELEFQRYRPRRVLTQLLNQYDLIQVVAGTPAWGFVARDVQRPICIFTATTARQERTALISRTRGWRKAWLMAMTHINTKLEQQALQHAAYVFPESPYTLETLSSIVPPEKLVLGPPGVDTHIFYPVTYQEESYILSVGRFSDPRKNARLLFEAYHKLRQTMANAPQLVLAGRTGPNAADWHYAQSLGIANHIQVHQDVSLTELSKLYQNASLYVLTSDEEGLGIVLLEAMASGLPVISTRCGGPDRLVREGETGFLVPVGDALQLAEKMHQLILNPTLRHQMGRNGRQLVEARYTLEAAGKVYLDKYDELLSK